MRTFPAFAMLATLALAQTPPAPVVSPDVHADRRVTFRLRAPKANEVSLRGEWLSGQTQLVKDTSGVWSVTLGPIAPDIYSYSFVVDGLATLDPGTNQVKGSSRGFGASILEVPGERLLHEMRDVPHGAVHAQWYKSPAIGGTRRFYVYTPPDYDKDRSARYPVLYLLHGNGDTEAEWPDFGRANLILDNLLAESKIRPMLVVMPYGHTVPPNNLTPETRSRNTELMQDDVVKNIIPTVDAHYRTAAGPRNRAIAGLSMGGGQSINIGLNNLGKFSWVAVFSAGVNGGGPARESQGFETKSSAVLADAVGTNKKLSLLWIGCGNDDPAMKSAEQLAGILDKHKIRYTMRKTDGAHTWRVWRRYLAELTPLLFRPQR